VSVMLGRSGWTERGKEDVLLVFACRGSNISQVMSVNRASARTPLYCRAGHKQSAGRAEGVAEGRRWEKRDADVACPRNGTVLS